METIKQVATRYAQDKYLPLQTAQAVEYGARYVLSHLIKEFVGDCTPDNSSCGYQWEMKEFINNLLGKEFLKIED